MWKQMSQICIARGQLWFFGCIASHIWDGNSIAFFAKMVHIQTKWRFTISYLTSCYKMLPIKKLCSNGLIRQHIVNSLSPVSHVEHPSLLSYFTDLHLTLLCHHVGLWPDESKTFRQSWFLIYKNSWIMAVLFVSLQMRGLASRIVEALWASLLIL